MVKSERDKALAELASRIFDSMVEELVMDNALSSHHEIAKSRATCHVCHTKCGLDHGPGSSSSNLLSVLSASRHPTPVNGSSGTGTPTSGKADATVYFECTNCKRQIASNRYAPHLSSCMGIGSGTRRTANRSGVKSKVPSEAGRSQSPYVASENGNMSDEATPSPVKGRPKGKVKRNEDGDSNLKRKRTGSPQLSPNIKKTKKQKTSGSPVSRVRADGDSVPASNNYHLHPTGSQSKIPSKLRDSSIASFGHTNSLPSSRSTSPGTPMASHSTEASFSAAHSPPLPTPKKKGRPPKTNGVTKPAPIKRTSPPRPSIPIVRVPEPEYHIGEFDPTKKDALKYRINLRSDVEGEETGSSTDSDSS